MEIFDISIKIAEFGLVVHENFDKNELYIARPASVQGTSFHGFDENNVVGISNTILIVNAPTAIINITGKGKKRRYLLDISIAAAPGPGPEWFNEKFKSAEEVIKATYNCYFSDEIDFKNPSLEGWYGKT